ncbi:PREDICTED: epidermal growth factor receptor substrate 15-like 1 isoform X2 [Nicrophorus vespilloides]|uniref:Epidermal growth factor receptor substrate 15-like 1 isoform X2 n=1 Tax=Nicrophorus vespilloides TaxID=110193 RepID=A0ABM1NER1_NICVS|nr:PREDICTED: epidermal growth factor receptor substrate 15-like 1 isoform X2 [Nicrophorus vespilloides]
MVAGNNNAIYEAYYNYVDSKGIGTVGAMEAAHFLKKSGLSDVVLSRIWDLSDPGGRGCLDKTGMFVALKLVSLAQAGRDINMSNINLDMAPPKMGEIQLPKPKKPPLPTNTPLITSLPPTAVDWTVKPSEREKYDTLFDSLQPINGMIPGNKVKNVLMDSKLPLETLGKIWDLADQDKDGMLDRPEFVAAMHLVYKALEKNAIPNTLPPELMPPVKRKGSTPMTMPLIAGLDGVKPKMPPSVPAIPPMTSQPVTPSLISTNSNPPPRPVQPVPPTTQHNWVVTVDEKAKSDALFIKSDVDKDGFVSGQEIKDVFLQSGVPQQVLAHIWALCDINQSGKLNNEQFALAMWFVARCLKGVNPPPSLNPDMIPPSYRSNKSTDGPVENNNTCYSNPELEMISKDIQELAREKYALESDIAQKEADIKVKSGEIKSLQSELDTLAATLKQLENQKGEAMKRLGDLKAQKTSVDSELEDVQLELDEHSNKVERLRSQAAEQAEVIHTQEAELMSKKEQLESLKQEEQRLEHLKADNTNTLDSLSGKLQSTQLNISQAKALITQLQEQSRQMHDAIATCDTAISSGDASTVVDTVLRINPDFRDAEYKKLISVNGMTEQNGFDNKKSDPFTVQNGHSNSASQGFDSDPFASDPFKANDAGADGFAAADPFNNPTAFAENETFAADPFNNFESRAATKPDPFNAFGDAKANATTPEPDKDPFGCDPFAVLHAPTRDGAGPGRPTSPSPALPPKKSKPPRPAPPRPQPPSFKAPQQDPFSAPNSSDPFSSGGAGGFADFADFDAKFSDKPSATKPANVPSKGLEFTDDPFRDYRYEDPFNIAFDDEPSDSKDNDDGANSKDSVFGADFGKEDKFDPFGLGGRQSVPLPSIARSIEPPPTTGRLSAPPTSKNKMPSEDKQLEWAALESLRLEDLRKQRQLQEQADLEMAIALSKADNNKQ